jgi:hypothetical protein
MNIYWWEVVVYAVGIALILVILAVAHFTSKPCRVLSVEELEEIWHA